MLYKLKTLVATAGFFFSFTAWSADSLKEELINLFGAAGEYIMAGYQLSYLDRTACGKYHFHAETTNSFVLSKNDVSKMIPSDMFVDLLHAIEPLQNQSAKEVEAMIGPEPNAFNCGKAKGITSISFEQSQKNWFQAAKKFNQVKQDQNLTH